MVDLTPEERALLVDILNSHLEGMDEARECMIDDPVSFVNMETFTETMQQHDLDVATARSIKEKVINDDAVGSRE